MVRFLGPLVGLVFVVTLAFAFVTGLVNYISEPPVETAEHAFHLHPHEPEGGFSSDGAFGHFDKAQLQRGFQVYKEVCSSCHSLRLVAFRDLEALGYTEAQVKTIATEWAVEQPSLNPETGEASTRKNLPSDRFPAPFPNEIAARAGNAGALPPDLSLMTKARHDGGAYVYSLLTGFKDPKAYTNKEGHTLPAENQPGKGLHFNPYFANLNLAMAPPLTADGQVTYAEGNPKPTVDQMAQDVSAFLIWTAEPKMEVRKASGRAVLFFLLIFTALTYMSYKTIWAPLKAKKYAA